MIRNKLIGGLAAAALLVGSLSGCAAPAEGEAGSGEPDVVTVRHSWIPDDLMVPIAAAKALGYYAENNMVVVDQVGNGGATGAQLVANGEVMIGVGEAIHVFNGRAKGLPIVNIATQGQEQPGSLLFYKDSGIEDWDDLRGRKIGSTVASSSHTGLLAALALQGLTEEDVQIINLPAGANLTALPAKQVDASISYLGNIAGLEFEDELAWLTFAEAGYLAPATGYFVHEDTLRDKEELLTRWLEATLRGLEYAIANPDEVGEFVAKDYANVSADEVVAKWKLNLQFVDSEWARSKGLGMHNPDAWKQQNEILVEAGILDEEIDLSKAFTDVILEKVYASKK